MGNQMELINKAGSFNERMAILELVA